MVQQDKSGVLVFVVIGVSRAVQGACTGLFFVIVQVREHVPGSSLLLYR